MSIGVCLRHDRTYIEGISLANFAGRFIISSDVNFIDKIETISIEMVEVCDIVSLNHEESIERCRTCVDKFLALLNTLLPSFFLSSFGVLLCLKTSHGVVFLW
jgi:hypothetical protein